MKVRGGEFSTGIDIGGAPSGGRFRSASIGGVDGARLVF
jgi:hypothetical protein